MPLPPLLLAIAVMAVWGTNFVVISFALEHLPPLVLAALRFALVFVPMALFVKPPKVKLSNLAAYGVLIGAGQAADLGGFDGNRRGAVRVAVPGDEE